jgi:hypothetical protein
LASGSLADVLNAVAVAMKNPWAKVRESD